MVPQTEEQRRTAERWMNRPIPGGCTHEPLFFDPSAQVAQKMGGGEFFFDIGAKFIHRVGLMRGMAWEIPYGAAKDGINYVRVSIREGGGGLYDILFGKRHDMREDLPVGDGIINPFSIETVRIVESVAPDKLREVYDRETINA